MRFKPWIVICTTTLANVAHTPVVQFSVNLGSFSSRCTKNFLINQEWPLRLWYSTQSHFFLLQFDFLFPSQNAATLSTTRRQRRAALLASDDCSTAGRVLNGKRRPLGLGTVVKGRYLYCRSWWCWLWIIGILFDILMMYPMLVPI